MRSRNTRMRSEVEIRNNSSEILQWLRSQSSSRRVRWICLPIITIIREEDVSCGGGRAPRGACRRRAFRRASGCMPLPIRRAGERCHRRPRRPRPSRAAWVRAERCRAPRRRSRARMRGRAHSAATRAAGPSTRVRSERRPHRSSPLGCSRSAPPPTRCPCYADRPGSPYTPTRAVVQRCRNNF